MTTQYIRWPTSSSSGGGSAPTIAGTVGSPITNDGTSTLVLGVTLTADNVAFVASTGGAVTMIADPQLPSTTVDGATLTIFGTSNTNTLTFVNGSGLSLNGSCVMNANQALTLRYDLSASLWREQGRRA